MGVPGECRKGSKTKKTSSEIYILGYISNLHSFRCTIKLKFSKMETPIFNTRFE